LPLGDAGREDGGRERALDIAEAMLPELRDLDPGERAQRPADVGQLDPGRLRIALASEASEQPRALAEEPTLRPRSIAPERIGGRPRVGDGIPSGSPPVVGSSAR